MSDRKRTWSEIDRAKEKGRTGSSPKQSSQSQKFAEKKATTAAKKELDKLFSTSKTSKEKTEWLQKLKSWRGKPEYYVELTSYVEKNGVPRDWEIQQLLLDHRDPSIVIKALEEIKQTIARADLNHQELVVAKLNVIEVSTFDDAVVDLIKEIKKLLLISS